MMRNTGNKNAGARKLLDRLAEEKKKSVTALCLIAVMIFMWVRVLTKKEPQGAEASAPGTEQADAEDAPREEYRVSFVELPKVAGRNDVIGRDFFACDDWRHFVDKKGQEPDGIEEVSIFSKNGNEEVIRRIAGKLKLEATMEMGGTHQAWINGELREVGDKIPIGDGSNKYECEVKQINDKVVVIKCEEAEITLSIKI
jgi:hypothetical protein